MQESYNYQEPSHANKFKDHLIEMKNEMQKV